MEEGGAKMAAEKTSEEVVEEGAEKEGEEESTEVTALPPATTFCDSSVRFTMHSASCSDRSTSSSEQ